MKRLNRLDLLALFVFNGPIVAVVLLHGLAAYWLVVGPLLASWTYLALRRLR